MLFRNRFVKSWINCSHQSIKILYYYIHHFFIFLHFLPFYCRCVSSFPDLMHMHAATMLPFEPIPKIFQIPLPLQNIIKENLKPLFEKPNCDMRIIDDVLMIVLVIRWHKFMELGHVQICSAECKEN